MRKLNLRKLSNCWSQHSHPAQSDSRAHTPQRDLACTPSAFSHHPLCQFPGQHLPLLEVLSNCILLLQRDKHFFLTPHSPYSKIVILKLEHVSKWPEGPLKTDFWTPFPEFLVYYVWCEAQEFAFLTSSQIRSVTQSCLTLCDPMNHSTPGLPVHHQLPEFTETHVHRVSDAIHPSHPLSSPSPLAPNPSQHQSLFPMSQPFTWGGQSTGVSALASFLPKKSQGWYPLEWTGWISLQSKDSQVMLIRLVWWPYFENKWLRTYLNHGREINQYLLN